MRLFPTLAAALLMGCTPGAFDGATRLGSSAGAASEDAVYVTDEDNGSLARVSIHGDVTSVVVGNDPKRVARVGDRLYVTLAGERSVAVVHDDGNTMSVEKVVEVGTEPWGLVAHPRDAFLYVALATEDAVVELSLPDLTETRRFEIAGQPRWLAVHPSGKTLWVAGAMMTEGYVSNVDLEEGIVNRVALPIIERDTTGDVDNPIVDMTPRLTGDIDISNDGSTVAIPTLYVDHVSAPSATTTVPYYTSTEVSGIARFNPAVVTFDLTGAGQDKGEGTAVLMATRGLFNDDGCVSTEEFDCFGVGYLDPGFGGASSAAQFVRGYLASVTFSDDSDTLTATVEGARSVITVPTLPTQPGRPSFGGFDPDGMFESTTRVVVGVGAGARALIPASDGSMYAWSFLDRTLAQLDTEQIHTELTDAASDEQRRIPTWSVPVVAELEPSSLPHDIQAGRELYFATLDTRMTSAGAGVSCATCHFEGRNDGLSWALEDGPRQTPSLAGAISHTAPFTWTTEVDTVAADAIKTSQSRMGGSGISHDQAEMITAFVDYTRDVDVPLRGSQDPAVARGMEIFQREDTQCSTCHNGERFTDNNAYAVYNLLAVDTPALIGVAATAPYLHDGSAPDLRAVIERADEINMGHTAQLSDAEKSDLEMYLRSL